MKNSKVSSKAAAVAPRRALAARVPATRAGSPHKLWLGALISMGGASLLVGGLLLGHASQSAPSVAASPVTNAPQTGSALGATGVPYAPSKYPGVMVRNVPAAAHTGGAQKGWIYLKPGAKISDIKRRYGTRGGVTYEAGKTSAGGTIAHVDPSFYPYAVARVKHDKKGSHVEIAY